MSCGPSSAFAWSTSMVGGCCWRTTRFARARSFSRRTSRRATCAATTSSWRTTGASRASSCRSATDCRSLASGTDRFGLRQVLVGAAQSGEGEYERENEQQNANAGENQCHVVRALYEVTAGERSQGHHREREQAGHAQHTAEHLVGHDRLPQAEGVDVQEAPEAVPQKQERQSHPEPRNG